MKANYVLVNDNSGNDCVDTAMNTFEKDYDGESLYDLSRDIHEAFQDDFNPIMKQVPRDEYGFHQGTFRITIEWISDDKGTTTTV